MQLSASDDWDGDDWDGDDWDGMVAASSSGRIPVPPHAPSAEEPAVAPSISSSSRAVTLASPDEERTVPPLEGSAEESLVRARFLLTDELGRPLRRQRPLGERVSGWAAYVMPFSLRERDWGLRGQIRARVLSLSVIAAALVVALIAGLTVFHWAEKAGAAIGQLPAPQTTVSAPSGIIVQSGNTGAAATPTLPTYLMGAWVSDTAPTSGSQVQVFVRVTGPSGGPVANQAVTLSVQYPSGTTTVGPVTTDAYGLATFNVPAGKGTGSQVVFITASAKVNGATYTATTTFTPY